MAAVEVIQYSSWNQFKSQLFLDLFGEDHFIEGRYIFRGQGSADWRLETSCDRWFRSQALSGERWEPSS